MQKPTLGNAIGAIFSDPRKKQQPAAAPRIPTVEAAAALPKPTTSTSPSPSVSQTQYKTSLASQNQPYGGTPDPNDPAMIGGRVMAEERAKAQQNTTPTPPPTPSPPPTPTAPPKNDALTEAYNTYVRSLAPSQGLTDARKKYADFVSAEEGGLNRLADQPIAQSFITGQQSSLRRQNEATASRLQRDVTLAEQSDAGALAQNEARYKYAQLLSDQQRKDEQAAYERGKPIEVGGVLVDPVTFQPVYTPPKKSEPIQVSEGNTLYDPVTGQAVYTAPKSYKATGGGSGTGGTATTEGSTDPTVLSWTQNILNGRATLANVPAALKNAVSAEVSRQSENTQRLSSAQASEIADINTLDSLISGIQAYGGDGTIEGVGPLAGPLGSIGSRLFGTGSDESKAVRASIGNIRATIAKLRAGTSFTANEEKLLDTYTPKESDSQSLLVSKMNGLQQFLTSRKGAIIQSAQGVTRGVQTGASATGSDPLGIR